MKTHRLLYMFVAGLLSFSIAHADVEITHDFTNDGNKAIKDLVFTVKKPAGAKFTGVVDKDGFATGDVVSDTEIKFDGGNVTKDMTVTVKYKMNVEPDVVTHKESYVNKDQRGSDNEAQVFSKAIFGGTLGLNFASVNIPADEYGYFYQFSRNALYDDSPDTFSISLGNVTPTSYGVIDDTWPVPLLLSDLPDITVFDGSVVYHVNDHMTPDNLSGQSGVDPAAWAFANGQMVATYSSVFSLKAVSSILWFTSSVAPEIGGSLGVGAINASIFSGGGSVLEVASSVIAPAAIPEPSMLSLLGFGTLMLFGFSFRFSRVKRNHSTIMVTGHSRTRYAVGIVKRCVLLALICPLLVLAQTTKIPMFVGKSPAVSGSAAALTLNEDPSTQQTFSWQSVDAVLGTINLGPVTATRWTYVAGSATQPARVLFTATSAGTVFSADVLLEPYNRAVVDIQKNGRRIRYLMPAMHIEFITKGDQGALLQQQFSYNSVPCPVINGDVTGISIAPDGGGAVSVEGTVTDDTSDLVDDPAKQVQTLEAGLEETVQHSVSLSNAGSRIPPWQPYQFIAPFSTQITFQTSLIGSFRLSLRTSENAAGCAANLDLMLHVEPNGVSVSPGPSTDPGTFLPTLLRIDAPDFALSSGDTVIHAFGRTWAIQRMNFGDGDFWYAVDSHQNATVFLPAAYAHSHIQTQRIPISFDAEIIKGAREVGKGSITMENGLLVFNDDVTATLANITNFDTKRYEIGPRKVFIYKPKAGMVLGHANNELATEILWRFVSTLETIVLFNSQAELMTDVTYREKVVEAAKAARFAFGGPTVVNPAFWERAYRVKNQGANTSATDAVADMFTNANADTLYKIGCFNGAGSATQRGASQALGKATFDALMVRDVDINRWRVLKIIQQPNLTNGKPDNAHANNAKWIPGDWGYIANNDPAFGNPATRPANYGFVQGENVIYLGGSFDTDLASFRQNADFWGLITGQRIKKFKDWIAGVGGFTAGAVPVIKSHREILKQPPFAGNVFTFTDINLTQNQFAGGTLTLAGGNYPIVATSPLRVTTGAPIRIPFSIKNGVNMKTGTILVLVSSNGKSITTVTDIVMTADEFKDGTMTIDGKDYRVASNTIDEISLNTAAFLNFTLTKGTESTTGRTLSITIPR